MRRHLVIVVVAALVAATSIAFHVPRVAAACADNHITLYVNAGGGNPAQTFCLELTGNIPNLNDIPGPCPQFFADDSWNDCVSSVRVKLATNQCFRLYSNANYNGVMATYWGPKNEVLYNVSPNDALSSMKQYTKHPLHGCNL